MALVEYGLSATGFRRKRLPEIIQDLNERVSDKLGVPIETGANSIFGQLHGVYGFALAEIWENLEKIYNAMYPSTANGVSLSNAAGLAGIAQISAEKTTIIATCYGNESVLIPYGANIASRIDNSMIFTNLEVDKRISASQACEINLTIPTVEVGKTYQINLDGEQASYRAADSDTSVDIFSALALQFEFDDKEFVIDDDGLTIEMNDAEETFSLSTSTINIARIGTPYKFECVNYGANAPPIGTVTHIITNYSGWTDVVNNKVANVARNAETDTELRQRWARSVYARGLMMTDAIAASIYQYCDGVTLARVYENTSDEMDSDGRPPHSIEAVVEGGDPQEICKVILEKKAAGIDTYGSIKRTITDIQGVFHPIYFNRPVDLKIWLKIELSTEDNEVNEILSGLQNIKKAILERGATYEVGQDVKVQTFYQDVYNNTTGVGYVTITSATGETPSLYSAKNIKIDCRHRAVFDESRIEVIEL